VAPDADAAAGLLEPAHATEDIALRIRGRPSVAEVEQQLLGPLADDSDSTLAPQ
jgi:hypothetical protein